MDDRPARAFVIDLTHAVEACEFAAALLAAWRRQRPAIRLSFLPGAPEHERLLEAHGLEVIGEGADLAPSPVLPRHSPKTRARAPA